MKLQLSTDWKEFLHALIARRVRFVLVGGHAVAAWGEPRMTEDLDVLVGPSLANARRLRRALADFGFGDIAPTAEDFLDERKVWMLGRKPNRIDILTAIDGVSFAAVWRGRVPIDLDGGELFIIGREELLANKRAARRPKDLADVAAIERMPAASSTPGVRKAATAKKKARQRR